MENEKEYCEKLYREYKELKKRIDYTVELRDYHPGEKMEARPPISEEDNRRFPELKKKLREKCLEFFSEDILSELFEEADLRRDINRILMERIKSKK